MRITFCSCWAVIAFLLPNFQASCQSPTNVKGWDLHIIDDSSSGADGVKLGDVNKDGRIDVVTGWEEGGLTKIYIRPESLQVHKQWPAVIVGKTPDVEDAVFADLNGDGQLDVISCSEGKSRRIYIHFALPTIGELGKNWDQEVLPVSNQLTQWMYAEPAHIRSRKKLDLVAASKGKDGQIGWFQVSKSPENLSDWQWHRISNAGWIMSIIIRDMDADGDQDIIVSDRKGNLSGCRWLENPGRQIKQKQPWNNHFIGAHGEEVMFMTMADLDGDGHEEAIVAERSRQNVRIFRNTDSKGKNWQERIIPIPSYVGTAKSVEVGDLDNDGIPDLVLSTNTYKDNVHGLVWVSGMDLRGDPPHYFQSISGIHPAKYDKVVLLDIDMDGDLDILTCEENYGPDSKGLGVCWYENKKN